MAKVTPRTAKNAGVHDPAGTSVPVDQPGLLNTNRLITKAGRGMKNGIPYGEQLRAEQDDMNRNYRFRPGARARLAAATRRALGR